MLVHIPQNGKLAYVVQYFLHTVKLTAKSVIKTAITIYQDLYDTVLN